MSDLPQEMKTKVAQAVIVRIIGIFQKHNIDYMELDENLRTAIVEIFQLGVRFMDEEYGSMGKDVS